MDSQFCQVHTPHPLGEDKDRFQNLINDIKNRKDDYAAQLGHLTLAALSQNNTKGEDAKHQIMSTILGRPVAKNDDQSGLQRDKIWHARLVLAIGEILDKEQEDVASALMILDESESELFGRLKGADEEDEAESLFNEFNTFKSKLNKAPTQSILNRFRAWFRLVRDIHLPECPIWSTTREEAADILFESHQKETGQPPAFVAELQLPATLCSKESPVLSIDADFREKFLSVTTPIYDMIVASQTNLADDDIFKELTEQWHTLLNIHYPEKEFGRISARFYNFSAPLTHFAGLKNSREVSGASVLAVLSI